MRVGDFHSDDISLCRYKAVYASIIACEVVSDIITVFIGLNDSYVNPSWLLQKSLKAYFNMSAIILPTLVATDYWHRVA